MDFRRRLLILTILTQRLKVFPLISRKTELNRRQLILSILYRKLRRGNINKRKFWVRDIFTVKNRLNQGAANNLLVEMRLNDKEKYFNYLRMSPEKFNELLSLVGPIITKKHVYREPISAATRLALTLRYLASGDSMTSLSYAFRVGLNTVSCIIPETCSAIWTTLKKTLLSAPTEERWKSVANDFHNLWHFPNCIGALDGKHVVMQAIPNSGSTNYNYKGAHSLVLMAMCDAYLRFTLVDIGAAGRQSDGGVLKHSAMGQMLQANQLNVPVPAKVGNNGPILPFVVVADEAFPLTTYMMRPFPRRTILNNRKKLFNYRLSRARRLIESCFGILSSRWRIYRKPIIASESTIITIIQATTCLHNFLMNHENNLAKSNRQYSNINSNEDVTADALLTIGRTSSNTFSRNASAIREKFTDYFEGAGAVEWQWEKVLQNDF